MLFSAEISDFRVVHNVLKAITLKEYAILRPMEEGLKITIEEMRCVETSAYLPSNMFNTYYVDTSQDIMFKISLKVLTECFHIFGDDGNPSLKLSYKRYGEPLCLVIKHLDENITVDCEIKTLNCEDFQDISLGDECNLNKIVINANIFQEMLHRLDNSADEVHLTFGPDAPHFKLTTTGISGESTVTISKHLDAVTVFQATEVTNSQYSFQNIRQILKIMNLATKVSISTGASGLLGFQLVIHSDDKQLYVEYYVTSLFGEDL